MAPRCIRNFWIDLEVDGKKEKVKTGPRTSGGGFQMTIKQRDQRDIKDAMAVVGHVDSFGNLVLTVDINGKTHSFRTRR